MGYHSGKIELKKCTVCGEMRRFFGGPGVCVTCDRAMLKEKSK